eukprot:gb/GFBE01030275.1/.p1 GENE.gb/GFBE01030275.1/~~gb/GFBE01030275.1/.p1  ORF type:complete len:672 (+),score=142.16 gb/GFBE01030275.1/:1-2016(+)
MPKISSICRLVTALLLGLEIPGGIASRAHTRLDGEGEKYTWCTVTGPQDFVYRFPTKPQTCSSNCKRAIYDLQSLIIPRALRPHPVTVHAGNKDQLKQRRTTVKEFVACGCSLGSVKNRPFLSFKGALCSRDTCLRKYAQVKDKSPNAQDRISRTQNFKWSCGDCPSGEECKEKLALPEVSRADALPQFREVLDVSVFEAANEEANKKGKDAKGPWSKAAVATVGAGTSDASAVNCKDDAGSTVLSHLVGRAMLACKMSMESIVLQGEASFTGAAKANLCSEDCLAVMDNETLWQSTMLEAQQFHDRCGASGELSHGTEEILTLTEEVAHRLVQECDRCKGKSPDDSSQAGESSADEDITAVINDAEGSSFHAVDLCSELGQDAGCSDKLSVAPVGSMPCCPPHLKQTRACDCYCSFREQLFCNQRADAKIEGDKWAADGRILVPAASIGTGDASLQSARPKPTLYSLSSSGLESDGIYRLKLEDPPLYEQLWSAHLQSPPIAQAEEPTDRPHIMGYSKSDAEWFNRRLPEKEPSSWWQREWNSVYHWVAGEAEPVLKGEGNAAETVTLAAGPEHVDHWSNYHRGFSQFGLIWRNMQKYKWTSDRWDERVVMVERLSGPLWAVSSWSECECENGADGLQSREVTCPLEAELGVGCEWRAQPAEVRSCRCQQ